MTVTAALLACRGRGMTERLLQGVQRALENNLIGPPTARFLRTELKERQQ